MLDSKGDQPICVHPSLSLIYSLDLPVSCVALRSSRDADTPKQNLARPSWLTFRAAPRTLLPSQHIVPEDLRNTWAHGGPCMVDGMADW